MIYIKDIATWKEVETPYIKVNGVWKESDKDYIKVGGVWADTSDLSATKLDYDMSHAEDVSTKDRYFINTVEPSTHKASMHSGNGVWLNGTDMKVPVPLDVNYGVENADLIGKWGATSGANNILNATGYNFFTIHNEVTPDELWQPFMRTEIVYDINKAYEITVVMTSQNGAVDFGYLGYSVNGVDKTYALGSITPGGSKTVTVSGNSKINGRIEVTILQTANVIFDTTVELKVDEITSLNTKSLLYYSYNDKSFKSVTLPLSITYNITEPFTQPLRLNKILVPSDIPYLNAHPEAIVDMLNDKPHVGVSFNKQDIIDGNGYWGGNEGEIGAEKVYEHFTSSFMSIVNFKPECRTHIKNVDYGMQNFFLKQDANGRTIGLAKDGEISGGSDGRWILLPLVDNTKQHHLVTKCLTEIKGDITQVTDTECP